MQTPRKEKIATGNAGGFGAGGDGKRVSDVDGGVRGVPDARRGESGDVFHLDEPELLGASRRGGNRIGGIR